jgi:hypothetical protein
VSQQQQQGEHPARDLAENLVAALTKAHVLLFDVRQAAQPIKTWRHNMKSPTVLTLICHVSQRPKVHHSAHQSAHCCLYQFSGIEINRQMCCLDTLLHRTDEEASIFLRICDWEDSASQRNLAGCRIFPN